MSSDRITCWTIDQDKDESLSILGTAHPSEIFQKYSRFKFGDRAEINWFSAQLFNVLRVELETETSSLFKFFTELEDRDEYIYFTSPGIRNVPSASNLLLQQSGRLLNSFLALRGWKTGIVKTMTRLSSGRANYAELSAKDRNARGKTTKTLIPISDYKDHAIHVFFFDDVIASGSTVERAERASLEGGALSFTAISLFELTPEAARNPQIEHDLNSYAINGILDETVASCLRSDGYVPVQRMLRLVLHPTNRYALIDFVKTYLSQAVVLKLCHYALANDYLSINAQPDGVGLYHGSLVKLLDYSNTYDGVTDFS